MGKKKVCFRMNEGYTGQRKGYMVYENVQFHARTSRWCTTTQRGRQKGKHMKANASRRDTYECLHTGVSAARSSRRNCDIQTPHLSTATPSNDSLSFTRPSFNTRRLVTSILPVNGTFSGEAPPCSGICLVAGPRISWSRRRSCEGESEVSIVMKRKC